MTNLRVFCFGIFEDISCEVVLSPSGSPPLVQVQLFRPGSGKSHRTSQVWCVTHVPMQQKQLAVLRCSHWIFYGKPPGRIFFLSVKYWMYWEFPHIFSQTISGEGRTEIHNGCWMLRKWLWDCWRYAWDVLCKLANCLGMPRVLRANSFGPVREVGSAMQFLSPKPWNL